MAFDEQLAARVRDILAERIEVTERKMFGGIAFMVRGHMTIGVSDDDLMLRVGPAAHPTLLKRAHARPMDFTGRPMKGYLYVDAAGTKKKSDLAWWIDQALAFNSSLPPK